MFIHKDMDFLKPIYSKNGIWYSNKGNEFLIHNEYISKIFSAKYTKHKRTHMLWFLLKESVGYTKLNYGEGKQIMSWLGNEYGD